MPRWMASAWTGSWLEGWLSRRAQLAQFFPGSHRLQPTGRTPAGSYASRTDHPEEVRRRLEQFVSRHLEEEEQ